MNFICKKCGHTDYELKPKGTAVGLYCSKCGFWHKWVGKEELSRYEGCKKAESALPDTLIVNGVKYQRIKEETL